MCYDLTRDAIIMFIRYVSCGRRSGMSCQPCEVLRATSWLYYFRMDYCPLTTSPSLGAPNLPNHSRREKPNGCLAYALVIMQWLLFLTLCAASRADTPAKATQFEKIYFLKQVKSNYCRALPAAPSPFSDCSHPENSGNH
jgi:hypothetical protein